MTIQNMNEITMLPEIPEGYVRIYNPLGGSVLTMPKAKVVKWVFATHEEIGEETCQLGQVIPYGLFIADGVGGHPVVWQRLPDK